VINVSTMMATSALLPKKALMADSEVRRRFPVALFSAGIDNSCATVSTVATMQNSHETSNGINVTFL
jgi:hypothetical protein